MNLKDKVAEVLADAAMPLDVGEITFRAERPQGVRQDVLAALRQLEAEGRARSFESGLRRDSGAADAEVWEADADYARAAASLSQAHRRALRRIARGDLFAVHRPGVAPYAVLPVGGGAHTRPDEVTAPAFRELRARGLIEFDHKGGSGPYPLRLTEAGKAVVA